MSIIIDLNKDYSEMCRQDLIKKSINFNVNDDIVIQYYNHIHTHIPKQPRRIEYSKVFVCPKGFEEKLQSLEDAIKTGEDLSRFLTKRIFNAAKKDNLLNDWGIVHFHLTVPHTDGVLLFAYVTDSCVYCIDVLDHDHFEDTRLLEVMIDNWPSLVRCIENAVCENSTHEITTEEVQIYRYNHLNRFCEYQGKMYFPLGGGVSMKGDSLYVMLQVIEIRKFLDSYQRIIIREEEVIKSYIAGIQQGHLIHNELEIKLSAVFDDYIRVIEICSGTVLDISVENDSKISIQKV